MLWTEKQIEDYLREETRKLNGPDGKSAWFTMYRMQWIAYDAVRVDDLFTEAQLVTLAEEQRAKDGQSLSDALRRTVDLLDHEIRKQNGWR